MASCCRTHLAGDLACAVGTPRGREAAPCRREAGVPMCFQPQLQGAPLIKEGSPVLRPPPLGSRLVRSGVWTERSECPAISNAQDLCLTLLTGPVRSRAGRRPVWMFAASSVSPPVTSRAGLTCRGPAVRLVKATRSRCYTLHGASPCLLRSAMSSINATRITHLPQLLLCLPLRWPHVPPADSSPRDTCEPESGQATHAVTSHTHALCCQPGNPVPLW